MKQIRLLSIMTLCAFLALGCEKKSQSKVPDWPWDDPVVPEPVEEGWSDVTSSYSSLPEYVKIFRSSATLLEINAIAYIAEVDLSKTSFEVWGINAPELQGSDEPLQTPSQIYEAQGKPTIVINAGYFYTDKGKSYSSSLEVSNGTLLSPNINYASQDWKTMYYPTRGAFLEHADGTYEVCWTYWKDASTHYIYDTVAENAWGETPKQIPNATFPGAARTFEAKNGIGGSPVLIKGGEIKDTYKQELIEIGADIAAPRTAIGITSDKKLVLFVCEGRNMTEGVPGYTTRQVAQILKDYGCTDALNLDGGGSSLMLVNGKELIKPSDGKQRSVASCVYIK